MDFREIDSYIQYSTAPFTNYGSQTNFYEYDVKTVCTDERWK